MVGITSFAGGFVGFLLRPAVFGEQLPFETVISRGASLRGLGKMAVPLAKSSFNYMMAGAIIGLIIGIFVARTLIPPKT